MLIAFLAGIGLAGFWFHHRATPDGANEALLANGSGIVLSDGTRSVLKRLDAPVEVRFYSLLDPASVSASVQGFSKQVDQLLAQYEAEANGMIKVVRYNSVSDDAGKADADGIKPFNVDKGDACYLGIALVQKEHKEALAQLAPEWGNALEADISRALSRLTASAAPRPRPLSTPAVTPAVTEEVKRAVPNFASISLDDGTRILREASLKDYTAAAKEMADKVQEAQKEFSQAQNGESATDQQNAMQRLQQVQSEQLEKLKQIAAHSTAQIEALRKLKTANP